MLVLGIDPGLDGALAFYRPRVGGLDVRDMPVKQRTGKGREVDVTELARVIDNTSGAITHAFLEQAWPRPGEASATAFKQGASFAVVRGVIGAHFVPLTVVSPQRWAKALSVGKGKDASRARASELLPKHASWWSKKAHDGRADAALIAIYGARQIQPAEGQAA